MALFGSFAKANNLSELTTSHYGAAGHVAAATRQAEALANLGFAATKAELEVLDQSATPPTLTTGAAAGITGGTGTVYTSAVTRLGKIVVTQLFIDLTGLSTSTTDLDVIGNDIATDLAAHIGQITTAQNGVIFAGWMSCVELPATGADDIDLYSATVGTAVFDDLVTDLTEIPLVTSGAAWVVQTVKPFTRMPLPNDFLYLTNGEAGTVGTYTAGQFYITMLGVAA